MSIPVRVLFVCLGNICRSPLAEALFQKQVEEAGLADLLHCDSAGTSAYHEGQLADSRTREVAQQHDLVLTHRSRPVLPTDFDQFDYLVAMDADNLNHLQQMKGASPTQLRLVRQFDPAPDDGNVPDPYYGGTEGFRTVHTILERSCRGLLEYLIKQHPDLARNLT